MTVLMLWRWGVRRLAVNLGKDALVKLLRAAGFTDIAHHRGDESTHMTNWFVAELPR